MDYLNEVNGKNGIRARMVADSVSETSGVRLCTMELRFHRFILPEFNTHRVFSRNASSSRAIPVDRMIRTIEADPAIPVHWGANQKGMQAGEELDTIVLSPFSGRAMSPKEVWMEFADLHAVKYAKAFSDAGYHKQIVNRLTEPFQYVNVVVTATEWDNFFRLRLHPAAQPEIQELAKIMKACMDEYSTPRELCVNEFHLPYISRFDAKGEVDYTANTGEDAIKQSVARCARVSYRTHDGNEPTLEEDVRLFTTLKDMSHLSPFEHVATPHLNVQDEGLTHIDMQGRPWSNNFREWVQYRTLIDF